MKRVLLLLVVGIGALSVQAQLVRVLPYEPGEGLQVESGKGYRLELSGMMQATSETRFYPETEGRKSYTRFRMRRMFTRLRGNAASEKIRYQVQIDLTGSSDGGGDAGTNNYLMDAWISWRPKPGTEIIFGQDNAPTDSRELTTLSNGLQFVERSVVSTAFSSIREFGVFAKTRINLGRQSRLVPQLALTNGDGANVFTADRGGVKIGGRLDFLPFGAFTNGGQYFQPDLDRERTLKLVIGAHLSQNDGISDRRGRESGAILYLDSARNETLPTYTKFGVDFLLKYRGFSASGEFVHADATLPRNVVFRVRENGTTSTSFVINNKEDKPAYIRDRMILGSGLNLQAGYLFPSGFSLDGRYSKLMPQTFSFLRNERFYNRPAYYSLGFGQFLNRNFGARIQGTVTYAKAETGSRTIAGQLQNGNEWSAAVMFSLSL